jgi:hypothetical protein
MIGGMIFGPTVAVKQNGYILFLDGFLIFYASARRLNDCRLLE